MLGRERPPLTAMSDSVPSSAKAAGPELIETRAFGV